jgi:predicted nucleic acid-binding protein
MDEMPGIGGYLPMNEQPLSTPVRIYLDVCSLCRPFDDQTKGRIRLEATAVQEIIRRCTDEFILVTSEVVIEEISEIPDANKRLRVEKIVGMAKEHVIVDEEIVTRMYELISMGGEAMDSLHIACAERAGAIFLTTDDGLITFFKSHQLIQVRVENPVTWLKEVNA